MTLHADRRLRELVGGRGGFRLWAAEIEARTFIEEIAHVDGDRLVVDQADAIGWWLVAAKHGRLCAKIKANLMVGAGQCRCGNAAPRSRDGSMDMTVK